MLRSITHLTSSSSCCMKRKENAFQGCIEQLMSLVNNLESV